VGATRRMRSSTWAIQGDPVTSPGSALAISHLRAEVGILRAAAPSRRAPCRCGGAIRRARAPSRSSRRHRAGSLPCRLPAGIRGEQDHVRLRQCALRVGEVSSSARGTAGCLPPHRPERAELPHSVPSDMTHPTGQGRAIYGRCSGYAASSWSYRRQGSVLPRVRRLSHLRQSFRTTR